MHASSARPTERDRRSVVCGQRLRGERERSRSSQRKREVPAGAVAIPTHELPACDVDGRRRWGRASPSRRVGAVGEYGVFLRREGMSGVKRRRGVRRGGRSGGSCAIVYADLDEPGIDTRFDTSSSLLKRLHVRGRPHARAPQGRVQEDASRQRSGGKRLKWEDVFILLRRKMPRLGHHVPAVVSSYHAGTDRDRRRDAPRMRADVCVAPHSPPATATLPTARCVGQARSGS
ncbi:hypothetical protein DFH09DRAFT_46857 [Mycena vulgaris]|nr:hypothetical protein DFH09DRAFT_46857 [Mycena vulgaris]